MQYPGFPAGARPWRACGVFALSAAIGLVGCAQLPKTGPQADAKPLDHYRTASSLPVSTATWPNEQWWTAYGDAQLDQLIDEALEDSPSLAAASARLRRSEAFGKIAGAALLPQISANASISEQKLSYNNIIPKDFTPQGWNDYGQATLDFSWELDFWGKNRAALAAATSQVEAARAEAAQARLDLATAVASTYADLARLFAERDTVADSTEVRRKTVELFAQRYANGLETLASLDQAKARLAASEGELLALDEHIGLTRNRIAALLGAGPDRGLAIQRPQIRLDDGRGLPADLPANLIGRRPDIAVARRIAEAQASRIRQKEAEFYPNVNLSAFIGVQSLGLDLLTKSGSSMGGIGPAISLPIFTGGRLRGELSGARAGYDEAVANYNGAVTRALEEVASAGLSQAALSAQTAKAEEAVRAAGEAHRIVRNRYEGGLANYIEVLYAQDTLLASQRNLAVIQSRAFALDVSLKHALGGGYQNPNT